jgi:AraC family transcriptional activator of pobA
VATQQRIPTFPDLTKPTDDGLVEPCFVERFSYGNITAERAALHRHPHYEIFWVEQGGGVHFSDFRAHEFGARSLIFVGMGRVHTWKLRAGTRGVLTAFSAEALGGAERAQALFELPFFCHLTGKPVVKMTAAQNAQIAALVASMLAEYEARRTHRTQALQAWLRLFLVECVRAYPQDAEQTRGTAGMLAQEFLAALDVQFVKTKRVGDYAKRLGVTAHRLIEVVRDRTGRTPAELIEERLYLEAKRLLFHTTRTVAEIAYELGFSEPSHFGRFFKRQAGFSPGEARERFFATGRTIAA